MQNFYPNYGYPMMNNGGYAYGVARPQPSNSQPLTPEIVNTLRQESNEFNMKIDQKDLWRAMCTHRDPTSGASTLTYHENGSCTCSICGETFTMFDGTTDEIKNAVETLINMFQTSKTIYLDAPVEMTKQYYQMIALLRKFPGLWDLACKNFAKYEVNNNPLNPISNNYGGGFNALNIMLTNPYAAMQGMYQQPMMGAQVPAAMPGMGMYQQPMMGGQAPAMPMAGAAPQPSMMAGQAPMTGYNPAMGNPMANGAFGMMAGQNPMDPNANPMAFSAPNGGVTLPTAQNAQAAPAPAQNNEVQQQKVYNV